MRYIYIALVALVTLAVLLFKVQNLSLVTISLLSLNLTMPASFLVVGVYFLGMVTGGTLLGIVRSWVEGARRQG